MKKNYLLLLFGISLFSLFACKKDTAVALKTITVTAKVLDADSGKPLENIEVTFRTFDSNNPFKDYINKILVKTNAKGECTFTWEDDPNVNCSIALYDGDFIEIIDNKKIEGTAIRNMEDRFGIRTLNHIFRVVKGGVLGLKAPSKAISNKDIVDIDINQFKNGQQYTNLLFNNLRLESIDPVKNFFNAIGFFPNIPIYVNYKYKSKNIWQRDTLQFQKAGNAGQYELKY